MIAMLVYQTNVYYIKACYRFGFRSSFGLHTDPGRKDEQRSDQDTDKDFLRLDSESGIRATLNILNWEVPPVESAKMIE